MDTTQAYLSDVWLYRLKFNRYHIDITWGGSWDIRILIGKQIIDSVSTPRDEFIKPN